MKIRNPRLFSGPYARPVVYTVLGGALLLVFYNPVYSALFDNGFDLEDALVPSKEIHHGGPPRDGIPAIDAPEFVSAAEVDFLKPEDRVLGITLNGNAKAYPIGILNFHEVVNDTVSDRPVVVSYCPLCGTGMAFSAEVAGTSRSFGVSGLLYNSDVLLYDRESESLWSQVMKTAVSGPSKGETLDQLPVSHTSWQDWHQRYPETLVLSTNTGYNRDYTRSPYAGYETSERIWFPVANSSQKYHPKELVIGIEIDGQRKAYPFVELSRGESLINDRFNRQDIKIEFDALNRTGRVVDKNGDEVPSTIAFWFAWYAFFPETEVYTFN